MTPFSFSAMLGPHIGLSSLAFPRLHNKHGHKLSQHTMDSLRFHNVRISALHKMDLKCDPINKLDVHLAIMLSITKVVSSDVVLPLTRLFRQGL